MTADADRGRPKLTVTAVETITAEVRQRGWEVTRVTPFRKPERTQGRERVVTRYTMGVSDLKGHVEEIRSLSHWAWWLASIA